MSQDFRQPTEVGKTCWRLTGHFGVPFPEVPMARTSIRERPDREEVLWPM